MKLSQINKPLYETPIGDWETIGLWGDKDRNSRFRDPVDRRLVQSPKVQATARRRFGHTEAVLNLYFVNHPEAQQWTELGLVSGAWVAKNMPETWKVLSQKPQDPEAINVLFNNNKGSPRDMMTPWIMAHRMAHAIDGSNRKAGFYGTKYIPSWTDAEREFIESVIRIFQQVYRKPGYVRAGVMGYTDKDKRKQQYYFRTEGTPTLLVKFFNAIGTMRSARQGQIARVPEFMFELFAQWVNTGHIKFNPLPRRVSVRGGPWISIGDTNKHDMEYFQTELENLERILPQYFANALEQCKGSYLVM